MRPAFSFYPDDWMNDLGLRGCSPASRGIWADILCMMHQGLPYGHLADSAGPIPIRIVASRCGISSKVLLTALAELESHNVFSRTDDRTIYSRRMVRDEKNRIARGQGGSKSLMSESVPRPKGILPQPRKDTFTPEEVKEKEREFKNLEKVPQISWEALNSAWKWYQVEYAGDVNPITDMQLFISVMESEKDLSDLYANLPLWKQTKRWRDGYHKESKNFLSERLFRIVPKAAQKTPSTYKQPVYFDPKTITGDKPV